MLTKCKACGAPIATTAEACPACGARPNKLQSGCAAGVALLILLAVAALFWLR